LTEWHDRHVNLFHNSNLMCTVTYFVP
jgi:hypothetical protein